jgi:low affinity Fe/Cu permease
VRVSLEIVVPVVMCAALLWWIGRGMSARAMLIATAVTLVVIVVVLYAQRAGLVD